MGPKPGVKLATRVSLPSQVLPPEFFALPPEIRDRIVREGQYIGDRIVSYVVQLLIGPPANLQSRAPVNHASGIQILVGATRYLATAAHIIRKVQQRTASGESIITQIGNAIVPVLDRVAWWSEPLDLAFVCLETTECIHIPASLLDSSELAASTAGRRRIRSLRRLPTQVSGGPRPRRSCSERYRRALASRQCLRSSSYKCSQPT